MKVVMLTAMAGAGLDLSYGDVFETDETEAKRLLDYNSAREFDPKLDAHKPVKSRNGQDDELPDGHFQNEKPKGKKRTSKGDSNAEALQEGPGSSNSGDATGGTEASSNETGESNDADPESNDVDAAGQNQSRPPRARRR